MVCLPMDDCLAQVAIDFGGRNWLVWKPNSNVKWLVKCQQMLHFFKSFSDGKANINIKAEGDNEHIKLIDF
jgi:imidazoleglycerol-phosphate dehydratase/histidinol-phosphatase